MLLLNCGAGEDESPLDCKEIKPVHPKENQALIFIGRTDAEAEAQILWPPDVKSWLLGKDPHAGKDWGQEEEGMIENEMVGWDHQLNGRESEQTERFWRTGKPGELQFTGLQRVRQDLATEQQQRNANIRSGFVSDGETYASLSGEEMEWCPGVGRNLIFVEGREGAIIFYTVYF